jgi:hypothetical protein
VAAGRSPGRRRMAPRNGWDVVQYESLTSSSGRISRQAPSAVVLKILPGLGSGIRVEAAESRLLRHARRPRFPRSHATGRMNVVFSVPARTERTGTPAATASNAGEWDESGQKPRWRSSSAQRGLAWRAVRSKKSYLARNVRRWIILAFRDGSSLLRPATWERRPRRRLGQDGRRFQGMAQLQNGGSGKCAGGRAEQRQTGTGRISDQNAGRPYFAGRGRWGRSGRCRVVTGISR